MAKRVAGPNNEKPATIADHDPDCGGWARERSVRSK